MREKLKMTWRNIANLLFWGPLQEKYEQGKLDAAKCCLMELSSFPHPAGNGDPTYGPVLREASRIFKMGQMEAGSALTTGQQAATKDDSLWAKQNEAYCFQVSDYTGHIHTPESESCIVRAGRIRAICKDCGIVIQRELDMSVL